MTYLTPGTVRWFEYHCFESDESNDAALWHRSHTRVTVVSLEESGIGDTKAERAINGCPAVYTVRFEDGYVGDVFEDELVYQRSQFVRPDPPKEA